MSPEQRLILLAVGALLLAALAAWVLYRVRTTPLERERKRRLMVNRVGRMTDGMLTDLDENMLYYRYSAMGVDYDNSQDVSALAEFLPPDRDALVGMVTVKYAPRNPANSIVICEDWSGLRARPDSAAQPAANSSIQA